MAPKRRNIQLTPRRRPWLLCIKAGTAKPEVKRLVQQMVEMMPTPAPLRDVEIRFIRPMTII